MSLPRAPVLILVLATASAACGADGGDDAGSSEGAATATASAADVGFDQTIDVDLPANLDGKGLANVHVAKPRDAAGHELKGIKVVIDAPIPGLTLSSGPASVGPVIEGTVQMTNAQLLVKGTYAPKKATELLQALQQDPSLAVHPDVIRDAHVELHGDWEATIGLAIRAQVKGDGEWKLGQEGSLVRIPIVEIPLPQVPLGAAGAFLHTANAIQLTARCSFSGKATTEAVARVGMKGRLQLRGDYTAPATAGAEGKLSHDFAFTDTAPVPLSVDVTSGNEADVHAECHLAPALVLGIQDTLHEFRAGLRVSVGPYVSTDGKIHALDDWALHTEYGRSGEIAPFIDITGVFVKKSFEQSFSLFRTPLQTWDASPTAKQPPGGT